MEVGGCGCLCVCCERDRERTRGRKGEGQGGESVSLSQYGKKWIFDFVGESEARIPAPTRNRSSHECIPLSEC